MSRDTLLKMQSNKFSKALIASAAIMVAFGDLRNATTPLGYWIIWGAWLVLAIINLLLTKEAPKSNPHGAVALQLRLFGFLWLFVGFFISAIYNSDLVTLYQAIKLLVICVIGVLINKHSERIGRESILPICSLTAWVSCGAFLLTKFIFLRYQVILGDGRQGSLIAYPGVLWKTGVFFSVFALAHILYGKRKKFMSLLVCVVGVYTIFMDGSRTGFLLITFLALMLFAKRILGLRYSYGGLIGVGGIVLVAAMYMAGAEYSQFANMRTLPLERLLQGDEERITMFNDGLAQAEKCLPVGCGFGSAVTNTKEGPMVIHNAYLSALADVGIAGFAGFILIILGPFIVFLAARLRTGNPQLVTSAYQNYTAALALVGFAFVMSVHPLSTEMSEWGLYFLMSSWMFSEPTNGSVNLE